MKKTSEKTRKKMRQAALTRDNTKRIASLPKGKKHWKWSNKPSILTLHKRVSRKFGKASDHKCVNCKEKAIDWALKTNKYSDNRNDYQPMCRKCHVAMDKPWKKRSKDAYFRNRDNKGRFIKTKKQYKYGKKNV